MLYYLKLGKINRKIKIKTPINVKEYGKTCVDLPGHLI